MKPRIVVIGASENQNPLILKAKEMGFEAHVFAWKTGDIGETTADYFYPISVIKAEQILDKCREIAPDAVVSMSSNMASSTAAFVARELGQPTNNERVLYLTAHKTEFRRALEIADIKQPVYLEVGDEFSIEQLVGMSYPLVVKPCDRSNSRGITLVQETSAIQDAILRAREMSYCGQAIVEEYVTGDEVFCECLSVAGEHHILCYFNVITTGAPDFSVVEINQPIDFHGYKRSRIDSVVLSVLKAVGIENGASHIKLLLRNDKNEIDVLRMSASMASDSIGSDLVKVSVGIDYLKLMIEVALGKTPVIQKTNVKTFMKMRYITDRSDIETLEWTKKNQPHTLHKIVLDSVRKPFYILIEPIKEMGGYLPLEISKKKELLSKYGEENIARLNSVRTAIWIATKLENARRIWIPKLYTNALQKVLNTSLPEATTEGNAVICGYHINEQFEPVDINYKAGDMVLLVNYYGTMRTAVQNLIKRYAKVIVDNSFSFFDAPVLESGVYNVYSCRRFFGVADGAYLVSAKIAEHEKLATLNRDISYSRMTHLLKSLELESADLARSENNANEHAIGAQRLLMSVLTQKLMCTIDYDAIQKKRLDNFRTLNSLLSDMQGLQITEEPSSPLCYPLLSDGRLRACLNKHSIHVPLLWRNVLKDEPTDSWEYRYVDGMLCLPIDQRYDTSDMKYLVRMVRNLSGEL